MPAPLHPAGASTPECPSCGRPLPAPGALCPECAETREDAGTPAPLAPVLKQIAGYRIVRELGSGGMGTVYEALDTKMNRRVALKVMSGRLAGSSRAADRFAREAWLAGRLNHPNLVKVFDRGEWEDLSYYSMELIEGGSLGDVIANLKEHRRDEASGVEYGSREYTRWAVTQIVAAARGLACAHREGILHRDIKPMNLLLSREHGTVKVADFGLAVDVAATRMTIEGDVLGTPIYMSPEQILGKTEELDARTDVYALGVTLFELLTLELPYSGGSQHLYVEAVLSQEARRPSRINVRVSRDLEVVVRKALQKDRRDRYATADDFAEDLENVLNFRPVRAHPAGAVSRLVKWSRRRPIHATLAALLIIGLPTLGVLGYRAAQHRRLVRQIQIEELERDLRWLGQQGSHREIVHTASGVLELNPRSPSALRARAMAYQRLWEKVSGAEEKADLGAKALADASKLIESVPERSWPHRVHARILRLMGREEEARQADAMAERYLSAAPTHDDLYFDALLAFHDRDYPRAVDLAARAILLNPSGRETFALRGDAHAATGDVQKAIQDYRIVLALGPDLYLNYFFLGRLLLRAGEREEGAGYIRRALEMAPKKGRSHEHFSHILLELGGLAASEGDQTRALEFYEKAEAEARAGLALDPNSAACHVNLGVALIRRMRMRETVDPARISEVVGHYQRALETWHEPGSEPDPGAYQDALMNLCDAQIELGDFERALAQCLEVSRLVPNQSISFYNLAGVYAHLGRADDAFQALEKGFELGDRDWQYLSGDPWFKSLRSDRRFKSLIERMKKAAAEPTP